MKKLSNRFFAAILTLVMFLTAIPLSVFATEPEASVSQGEGDVSVEATNSLGAMLTDSLETAGMEPDGNYTITDLTFEGNVATVSFVNVDSCNLVVAVYDETTMQMITSEVTSVEDDSASATVTFTEALPEYFVSKAFLLDDDYAPLCKEYTSRRNTTEFVEFMALETTDFEEDKVINLDESIDNNFLVLSDEAQKIKGDTETNILVSSDTETNTYVFENIDSNISSLKKGDIFHLDNGDMENLVVIKVASISIDGTTATIVAEASSLEEVFEFVKLDSEELKYDVSTDSAESEIVNEDGSFETDAWESTNEGNPWKETEYFYFEEEHKNDKGDKVVVSGSATFTLAARYKIYVDRGWAEISFILNPSAVLTITVTGSLKEREIKLGHIYFPQMYGVTIGAEPVLVFSASGNITITGTLESQIGFAFNTEDGFSNKSKPTTFKPEVNIEGEFYVGFNLSPYLSFMQAKNEALVDIKFKTEIGVTIKATYSNDSGHECSNCIDGDLLWSAKLNVDVAVLYGLIDTSDNKNYKKDLWSKKPTKFADCYYSLDHTEFGWGICPYSVVDSGKCCNNLTWILYNNGELKITGTGAMYDYDYIYRNRPWESYKDDIKSVVIGNGVTTIGTNAFCDCDSLTSVIIPDSVTTIGDGAFSNTSLSSIDIPDGITVIRKYAFRNTNITSVTIPDGVTTIEEGAFFSCDSLTSITIPDSVTRINKSVFCWCLSITDIYYKGTEEQWKKIYIGSNDTNSSFEYATIHYNSTGPNTDSASEFVLDSTGTEIVTTDPYCFEMNGVAGSSYTLLNVTDYSDSFVLSNSNLLYIDQVVADENGVITSSYIPKTYDENSTTLLIGDFGNGTEVKKLAKVNELGVVSVKAESDYIRYGDVVNVEVITTGTPSKIRLVDSDGNSLTFTPESSYLNSFVDNGDGTCAWNAKITMNKQSETYSVYAKYSSGWNTNCKELTLTAQPFDDSYTSTEFEVINDGVIYQGTNTMTVTTGADVTKVQLYKDGNTWTYTEDNATVVDENGVKTWTFKMNFTQLGDQTYYIRTRSRKTAFEVVDTLNLTVYSK